MTHPGRLLGGGTLFPTSTTPPSLFIHPSYGHRPGTHRRHRRPRTVRPSVGFRGDESVRGPATSPVSSRGRKDGAATLSRLCKWCGHYRETRSPTHCHHSPSSPPPSVDHERKRDTWVVGPPQDPALRHMGHGKDVPGYTTPP